VSNRPWWGPVVQWGLWAVAMILVMGWLARSRTQPRRPQDAQRLAHPRSTLIIGLACAGFFLTIAVLSAVFPGKTGSPALSLFFVGFAALGLPVPRGPAPSSRTAHRRVDPAGRPPRRPAC